MPTADASIYRPYARLVTIRVLGTALEVPEGNLLLRCFQYVAPSVPMGPFCWNGDCGNDRLGMRDPVTGSVRSVLACQTIVAEEMEIVEITPELARALRPALEAARVRAAEPAGAGRADGS